MKILLLGEFSGVHKHLKDGLVNLGHEVTIVANGDGFKSIQSDVKLNKVITGIKRIDSLINLFINYRYLTNNDVVQFVSPTLFPTILGFNYFLLSLLIKLNRKSFLLACGTDSFFWKSKHKFEYSPLYDYIKTDFKEKKPFWTTAKGFREQQKIVKKVEGVIACEYTYYQSYMNQNYKPYYINLPFSTKALNYQPNIVDGKIKILHGISRASFKGSDSIINQLNLIQKKYPQKVEVIIVEKLPYGEYLKVVSESNIVVDQLYAYGIGYNSLLSMSLGKITVGGGRQESLEFRGVKDCPIINLQPKENHLVQILESLIENEDNFEKIGAKSREYVEKYHESELIAMQYINVWRNMTSS